MLAKSNFLQSKYFIAVIIALFAFSGSVSAASDTSKKSCQYRVFNIKTSDTVSAIDLLTQIADSCEFSIIVEDKIAQDMLKKDLYAINIKNLSLDEIFSAILLNHDLYYDFSKNFLKISALKTKTFKIDYITSKRTGTAKLNASVDVKISAGDTTTAATGNGDNTITSSDNFDFWSTMLVELTSMLNTGEESYVAKAPIINQNAGLVTVTGTKQQLDRVEKYIKVLEKNLHRQVLIDVSILSVSLNKGSNTGIDWSKFRLSLASTAKFNNNSKDAIGSHTFTADSIVGNPTIDTTSAIFSNNNLSIVNDAVFSITGLIDFLNTNGNTKVVSSPKVLTMNNQQALITIGDNINYRVSNTTPSSTSGVADTVTYDNYSLFIGVLLNITPEITDKNEIILRINPSVSNFKYSEEDIKQTTARDIAPDTSEKKLSTVVKVHNGNTIILGGLITNSDGVSKSNVPILSDIPLLGEAFKHKGITKKTSELIFVITPRIIGPKDNTKVTLKDLGFSKRVYEQ